MSRLGDGDDDDMFETDDLYAEHRDIEGLAHAIQQGLGEIVEAVASQPVPRERENARLQGVPLGIGIKGYELLGDQCSEHVQAGAGYQAQLPCDGLHTEWRIAFPEQAQNRSRTRDSGRFAVFHGLRERAVRPRGAFALVSH